jgi:hypothetical protein
MTRVQGDGCRTPRYATGSASRAASTAAGAEADTEFQRAAPRPAQGTPPAAASVIQYPTVPAGRTTDSPATPSAKAYPAQRQRPNLCRAAVRLVPLSV